MFYFSSVFNENFTGSWHRVLLFDENLVEYVKNNVDKANRVLLRGSLTYQKFVTTNGQSYRGYIIGKNIQKLIQTRAIDSLI